MNSVHIFLFTFVVGTGNIKPSDYDYVTNKK